MISPRETDIGRRVIYARLDPHRTTEMGVLRDISRRYAFVRYGLVGGVGSAATAYSDLEWYEDVPDGTNFYDATNDPPYWRIKGGESDIYSQEKTT